VNDSTTDEIIRTFRWQPAGGSPLLDLILLMGFVATGIASAKGAMSILFFALLAFHVLHLSFKYLIPSLGPRVKAFAYCLIAIVAAALLQNRGDQWLAIILLVFVAILGLSSFWEASNVEIRWHTIAIGRRRIPYLAIRYVEVLREPSKGALVVLHLKETPRKLPLGQRLFGGSPQARICVSKGDVDPFVAEVARRARPGHPGFVLRSSGAAPLVNPPPMAPRS
jgi:hypothetical protein